MLAASNSQAKDFCPGVSGKLWNDRERRRLPPLNALRAFEAAARHLNFSRAADELSVTPGAVSQQIQNLEDYVGAALFKRTPKGLLLTDAAQTALPALREAFDRLAEAASLLTAAVDGRRLTLTAAALVRRQMAGAPAGQLRSGPSAGGRLALGRHGAGRPHRRRGGHGHPLRRAAAIRGWRSAG